MDTPARLVTVASLAFALAHCGGGNAPDGSSTDAAQDARTGTDVPANHDVPIATDTPAPEDTPVVDDVPVGTDVPVATDASHDAGTDAASADACAGRLLCDDFEHYDGGGAPTGVWHSSPRNGSIALDTTRAYSGSHSVHVHTNAGSSQSALIQHSGAPVFPVAGNVIYGRMMYWATAPANTGTHWTMIHADGPLAAHPAMSATYQYGGQFMGRLMANYYSNVSPTLDCWDHSATTMPTSRWSCYEWKFDGPHNQMQIWIDGSEITDIDVMAHGQGCVGLSGTSYVWAAPTFQTMSVGWESYQQDDARDAWVDDVIFDDMRIGCPPAR